MPGILTPDETHQRETRAGTKYEVVKWTCPKCFGKRSTLYIDDEWCHGESYHMAFRDGATFEQCGTCWNAEIDAMPHNQKEPT